jgi:thiamine-monophosphate kinase
MNLAVPLPEKSLIAQVRRMAATAAHKRNPGSRQTIVRGIGDDCAVLRLRQGCDSLVTTDFSLEGVHFQRDWHPAESVGHRCLARGLSDIAAMGGEPVAAFLSLALPRDLPQSWVKGFMEGLLRLAEKYGVILAGGDTAESPNGILADIIVVGSVPKGRAVLRSGARPGDRIYVSGALGGSAAAIAELQNQPKKKLNARDYQRHFYPEPRIELGRTLRERNLASAMIDISDGLSTDLAHICDESHVGAELDATLIPCSRVGKPAREVSLELALHGGEDYELLFTAPPRKRVPAQIDGVPLTCIGHITRSRRIVITTDKGLSRLVPHGWEHFRR